MPRPGPAALWLDRDGYVDFHYTPETVLPPREIMGRQTLLRFASTERQTHTRSNPPSLTIVLPVTARRESSWHSVQRSAGNSASMDRPMLVSAINKLAIAGTQAGFSLEQMIQLLDDGLSVESLLDLIAWSLQRRERAGCSLGCTSSWVA